MEYSFIQHHSTSMKVVSGMRRRPSHVPESSENFVRHLGQWYRRSLGTLFTRNDLHRTQRIRPPGGKNILRNSASSCRSESTQVTLIMRTEVNRLMCRFYSTSVPIPIYCLNLY